MDKYIDFTNSINEKQLQYLGNAMANGSIVIFPTETVYGIGTNGLNPTAIEKLYSAKIRNHNKPISLLVSSIDMIEQIAYITDTEYKLIKHFFPGPLTLILKKKDIVPDLLTNSLDTVGVRMPNCEISLKLIEYANVPIATSSANISGKPNVSSITELMADFKDTADYIVNGGHSHIGIASTIVQVIDNTPHILREGSITKEDVVNCL